MALRRTPTLRGHVVRRARVSPSGSTPQKRQGFWRVRSPSGAACPPTCRRARRSPVIGASVQPGLHVGRHPELEGLRRGGLHVVDHRAPARSRATISGRRAIAPIPTPGHQIEIARPAVAAFVPLSIPSGIEVPSFVPSRAPRPAGRVRLMANGNPPVDERLVGSAPTTSACTSSRARPPHVELARLEMRRFGELHVLEPVEGLKRTPRR
jgi:hypothetical protein